MFVTPASFEGLGDRLSRDAAQQLARNWTTLLLVLSLAFAALLIVWAIRFLVFWIRA